MTALIPLSALALVLLDAVADILPDKPLFWVVTPLRLVVLVGLMALTPLLRGAGVAVLRRDWVMHLCSAALLVAAAIPAVRSGQGWAEWRGLVTCVAIAYLAAGVMRSSVDAWRAVTMIAMVTVATAALTGVRQTVQGIPTGFCRGALDGTADSCGHPGVLVRALGTFGNPNLLAAFLVLMIPLAVAFAVGHTQRQTRILGLLVAAIGVAGVAATGSRAGLVAVATIGFAYLVLRRPSTPRLLAGVGAVVAMLAAGAVALATGAGIGVRTDVWRAAATLIRQYPLGVGWGRTGDMIAAVVPGDEKFQHAHNLWLDALLAAGPLGLAAVVGFTVVAGVAVVRAARRGSAAGVALGCSLAGFAVYCLFDNPVNAIRNAYATWAVLGLAIAAGQGVRYRIGDDTSGIPTSHPSDELPTTLLS